MQYENPPVDHSVNVSRESVLAEFLRLCAGLAIVVLVAAIVLYFAGGWLARLVPFAVERDLVGDSVLGIEGYAGQAGRPPGTARQEAWLQRLVDRLSAGMQLPEGMTLQVHVADSDVPNAFATLGGHIVVTRGLYRRMPNENALALVLAHEIAHVRARDPISSVGGAAAVGLTLTLVSGDADSLVPQVGQLVSLGYSRSMETAADDAALQGLEAAYGHAGGADEAFAALADYHQETGVPAMPTLLSTHPADATRLQRMRDAASAAPAERVPLPETFAE